MSPAPTTMTCWPGMSWACSRGTSARVRSVRIPCASPMVRARPPVASSNVPKAIGVAPSISSSRPRVSTEATRMPVSNSMSLSRYQSSFLILIPSAVFSPRMISLETGGRRYGNSGSSPMRKISPAKPADRMAAAALTPAIPAPTMTARPVTDISSGRHDFMMVFLPHVVRSPVVRARRNPDTSSQDRFLQTECPQASLRAGPLWPRRRGIGSWGRGTDSCGLLDGSILCQDLFALARLQIRLRDITIEVFEDPFGHHFTPERRHPGEDDHARIAGGEHRRFLVVAQCLIATRQVRVVVAVALQVVEQDIG